MNLENFEMDRSPRRHYSRAPIVEALIDIQVEKPAERTAADLSEVADLFAEEFTTRVPIQQLSMGFEIGHLSTPEMTNQHQVLGWRLDSAEVGRVLQLRTNGFTYSHLPPYSNWESFSSDGNRYWKKYAERFKPIAVSRMAVRVINRLPLPQERGGLEEYLKFFPTLPESLPNEAKSLFMQLQLPLKAVDPDAMFLLSIYGPPPEPNKDGIMLDIDLFVERSTPLGNEVFKIINLLGAAKDDIFEACITDKIRDLIA